MITQRSTTGWNSAVLELVGQRLSLEYIAGVAAGMVKVTLGASARARVQAGLRVVDTALADQRVVYGVNTGFGRLAHARMSASDLLALQLNLVRSHACGVGPPLSQPETRAVMVLRANTLALGHSGVRVELIEHLLSMLEHRIHPIIPSKGSVGASGDLAPLAHLALAIIGEGEVEYRGEPIPAIDALRRAQLTPQILRPKEGLALLNGTQVLTGVGALALHRASRLVALADLAGAMTLDALGGTPVAFDARIHAARPHPGQMTAATRLRSLSRGSNGENHTNGAQRVQDAYSLRCMPQVHGAVRGALAHVQDIVETESGSATDNPLVFPDEGEIISGGNFHGAPLALALDYAAIALTDLMSISERRIERLVNPDLNEGLPAFLTDSPGLSSGFMIAHVTAVSLLNEAKVLAHPASVDNVPTSGGQEDHVSMGMTAANKLRTVVENAERVTAIELLAAAQAHDYRGHPPAAPELQLAYRAVRALVPRLTDDRPMGADIERVAAALLSNDFQRWAAGPLLDRGDQS